MSERKNNRPCILTKNPADSMWLSAGKITIQVYILPLNPLLTVGG